MICRYEVTLNSVSLASVDPSILIHDVQYETPNYSRNLFQIANRHGARPGKTHKERAAVRVTFEIREYDIVDRQEVLSKIINWAKLGGDLRINDRPGKRLLCVLDEYPAINSVLKWTDELSMTFAAYDIPYWQGLEQFTIEEPYRKSPTGVKRDTYQDFILAVPGDAPISLPDAIIVENWTSGAEANHLYLDIQNFSRDDGLLSVYQPQFPARTSGIFEYSFDERQILTFTLSYNNQVVNLQGQDIFGQNAYDQWLSCGQENTLGISLTQRSSGPFYTPLDADITVQWRGYWE